LLSREWQDQWDTSPCQIAVAERGIFVLPVASHGNWGHAVSVSIVVIVIVVALTTAGAQNDECHSPDRYPW
jgi:hypothetical protein